MQINFIGHNTDVSQPLKSYANEKIQRLLRHSDKIIKIDFTFEVEKLQQIAKGTVHLAGTKLHADSVTDDMYKSVDLLVDKLDRQVREYKEQLNEHR